MFGLISVAASGALGLGGPIALCWWSPAENAWARCCRLLWCRSRVRPRCSPRVCAGAPDDVAAGTVVVSTTGAIVMSSGEIRGTASTGIG